MEDWTDSAGGLTWTYKLKALKPSSWISATFSINSKIHSRGQANFDFKNLNQNIADFDIFQILILKLYF